MRKSIVRTFVALGALISGAVVIAQSTTGTASGTATPLLTKTLPDVAGKEVAMLTVSYPPGGASSAHRHNADVFVYVLEGAVVMQVAGGQELTVSAGQTFHELPTDIHSVSRNASMTAPAKILVFAIKAQGAPLTVPEK
jgi:quercetin dioxygenase-like cupin family protein